MTTQAPMKFNIPSGTPPSTCKSCGQRIYWIKTAAGKNAPISIAADHCYPPDFEAENHGQGINHFVDCPSRDQHRKKP